MPMGKGTYGSQVGRPQKTKNSTDNYAQKKTGTGMNSTDNMNDGPIDRIVKKVKSNMSKQSKKTKKILDKLTGKDRYI